MSVAEAKEGGYVVTAKSGSGHTFTVVREASGTFKRTCSPEGKTGAEGGGCQNSAW